MEAGYDGDNNKSEGAENETVRQIDQSFLQEAQKIQETISFLTIKAGIQFEAMSASAQEKQNTFLWEIGHGLLARGQFSQKLEVETLEQIQALLMLGIGLGIQSGRMNYIRSVNIQKKFNKRR